jgi:pimeloyl-ACP methyl ester carboxylesterase
MDHIFSTSKAQDETHHDVRSFAHHTELPTNSVLLSSFIDPQGGSDSSGATETGVPLVHTIAIDRESKAVVLACRGTLGFEDVLADMMCDYDDLIWRGKAYKVHKGIHASARRLLYGGDGRVLYTLKEALEEFSDFGLVLCGHSLGGAVAAMLGVMLAEPGTTGTAFTTSAQQHKRIAADGVMVGETHEPIYLPAGRPIHVFAYGPPATMSPLLRMATRGLVTSVVHGNDLVPYLSLGVLHDFQALALAFKTDNNEAKAEVRRRIWQSFQTGLADKWYNNAPKLSTEDEAQWSYAALKTLRASMMSPKLLPPGEVFVVESTPALRRDAFVRTGGEYVGRTATRIVLKYIRDVETHFREIRFGASMLTDHSPGRYEDALRRLALGVM